MKKIVYIYGLKCPIDNEIRYIGKTINVNSRYLSHLKNNDNGSVSYKKVKWINSLKEKNLIPELVILIETSARSWKSKERDLIKKYKKEGIELYNTQYFLSKKELSDHRKTVKLNQQIKEENEKEKRKKRKVNRTYRANDQILVK